MQAVIAVHIKGSPQAKPEYFYCPQRELLALRILVKQSEMTGSEICKKSDSKISIKDVHTILHRLICRGLVTRRGVDDVVLYSTVFDKMEEIKISNRFSKK